jgi:hypothetical protein
LDLGADLVSLQKRAAVSLSGKGIPFSAKFFKANLRVLPIAGVSAAVVGVIIVVSLELIPSALVGLPSVAIVLAAFLAVVLLKIDVAFVALGAMAIGIVYVVIRALM